jgi:hypothetical protein
MSYTEKVILKINTLCFSVTLYLRVENTFETALFVLLQKVFNDTRLVFHMSGRKIWRFGLCG